jgi:hypothetical protein
MGSSSAVGVAVRNSSKIGRQNSVRAHEMNRFRSFLDIEPIGLISAGEQSYRIVSMKASDKIFR